MIRINGLILSAILAILVFGCAPAPTPLPILTPKPPPTPTGAPAAVTGVSPTRTVTSQTPPANSITLSNVETSLQPNGDIRTTAKASTQDNLGLGQIELSSPERMVLGDTATIRLRISPATQLTSSTPVPAPAGQSPNLPGFVYRFSGNVQLYPLMIAELRAITFTTSPPGPQQRSVQTTTPVEWAWLARSQAAGSQDLGIELSIPAVVNGTVSEITTDVLQNLSLTIQVDTPATPTPAALPTPTPDLFRSTVSKSIAENTGPIIIALIGLAGTIIGILVKIRSDSNGPRRTRK